MADRLTELQDMINRQAENICNAVGVLQQQAQPSFYAGFDRANKMEMETPPEDLPQLFSTLVTSTAKKVVSLVDSLPSDQAVASSNLMSAGFQRLEDENRRAANELMEVTGQLEAALRLVRTALTDVANVQLKTRALEAQVLQQTTGSLFDDDELRLRVVKMEELAELREIEKLQKFDSVEDVGDKTGMVEMNND